MNQAELERRLFEGALSVPPPQRDAFLEEQCGDPLLLERMRALLRAHEAAAGFLEFPPDRDRTLPSVAESEAETGAPHEFAGSVPQTLPYERLGEFRLVRELGRGGMGVVYLAYDEKLKRQVALKVISAILAVTESHLERFQLGARANARLSHPSIVSVYQLNHDKGLAYIVSEYIEGRDLAEEVALRKAELRPTWAPREAALLLAEVADALHHAHQNNVIHRDVKPSNILLDERSRAYLTDFGLAKILDEQGLTRTGDVAGTFFYMSPEQVRAAQAPIDHRTDVFSLGVVLYELVTGGRPFLGDTREAVLSAISSVRPKPLWQVVHGLPRDLDLIVQRALEKRPEDRYDTAADFAADLRRFAEGSRPHTRPPGPWLRLRRWMRRHPEVVWASGGTLAFLTIGILAGRATRSDGLAAVELRSNPSGAQVAVRPLLLETGEYGAPIALGSTPCRRRLAPGHYRFVFTTDDGFAEASRVIRADDPTQTIHEAVTATSKVASGMVRIEGGSFWTGIRPAHPHSPWAHDPLEGSPYAFQQRSVASYYIDRTEVTNADYGEFLRATGHSPPLCWSTEMDSSRMNLPVVGVTWRDARDYAEWRGKRLPTQLEWERAARGTDGRRYPWGDSLLPERSLREIVALGQDSLSVDLSSLQAYLASVSAVGTHPLDRTPDGLLDMLGNVIEWVDTPDTRYVDSAFVAVDLQRIAKGCSWPTKLRFVDLQTFVQAPENEPTGDLDIGFRCAKSQVP